MSRHAGWIALLALAACGPASDLDAGARDAGDLDAAIDAPGTPADADHADADHADADHADADHADAGAPIAIVLDGDPDDVASATTTTDVAGGGRARFSIAVPEGGPFVLYVAARFASGAVPSGASLALVDPSGAEVVRVIESEPAGGAALRMARLLATSGDHEITIAAGSTGGRVTLDVRLLAENDPFELGPARVTWLGPETRTVTIGRTNHQDDVDTAELVLPASSSPRTLRVRLAAELGGRFDPIVGHRVLRVTHAVEPAACAVACSLDGGADPALVSEASALCAAGECLLVRRVERSGAPTLEGLEAIVPLPPTSSATALRISVAAEGSAADAPLVATAVLADDPDEAARHADGVEQPTMLSMGVDTSGATYPSPPGSATTMSGTLVAGHGDAGGAVRAPGDYDAEPSDVDTYVLGLPFDPTLRAWELAWSVEHVAGSAPAELRIDVVLCDADDSPGGACTPVDATASGRPLRFVFDPAPGAAWFDDETPATWLPRWDRSIAAAATTTTVGASQCSCLEDRFARAGRIELRVRLAARASWEPVAYTVRTALTTYPRGYVDATGAARTCPTPCAATAW